MKNIKKILALVIAVAMVLAMGVVAFAADPDTSVSVKGIDKGDKVTAYQFVTWANGNWVVNQDAGITLEALTDGLTQAELGTIASHIDKYGDPVAAAFVVGEDGTWTLDPASPGSYIVLIQDVNNDTIYNPIVVSADYDSTSSNTITLTNGMALAKKEPVDVIKKVDNAPDDYDVQVGDIVPFTVETNVPTYNSNWIDPEFKITDQLSTGLTLTGEPTVTVEGFTVEKGTDYTLTGGAQGDSNYTIAFTKSFLQRVAGNPKTTIKYNALVGEAVKSTAQIHEESNTVTLEFSNNPNNSQDHGTKEEKTHHYTFAIDASRFGSTTEKTTELIKVGVDKDGNPITVYKEGNPLPEKVSPLAGATFTLTGVGPNGEGQTVLTATSTDDGRIFFNNLEVGTYTLEETQAPAGYIKDQGTHTVVIAAEYNADTTLKSYTITIDGASTATYSATTKNDGSLDTITPGENNQTFPINNKKGAELPTTGGIGTTIFYIVGAILVIGGGILLVSRRRMSSN